MGLPGAVLMLTLAGCAPPQAPSAPPPAVLAQAASQPPGFPAAWYRDAAARGEAVWQIDAAASLVEIDVRRGGPLAALGHDHLVAARGLQGLVAPGQDRADLFLDLDSLSVDEAALRAAAGMLTRPAADAIEGTRRNMLDKVLETQRYPYALIAVRRTATGRLDAAITLKGVTRHYEIAAQSDDAPGRMTVRGRLVLKQSDFGITPFSVLGGALQVEDQLVLRFTVTAFRT